jgi:hydrogenase-4 component F
MDASLSLALLAAAPAALGLAAFGLRRARIVLGILLAGAAAHLAAVCALWFEPVRAAAAPGAGALLALDPLGLLFLTLTSVIFLACSLYTVPYLLGGTHDQPAHPHRFVPSLLWFLAAMTLVTLAHNLALMWAAVEATTLASAPLVYFYRRRGALEATWKYLLICSVGIALALLGVFFIGIAASAAPSGAAELTLSALLEAAPSMPRPWLKAAFVLALVGFGTKMGLAPLHTWLPDTHSQAPSPVSALLSGALLNCAFLAILRFYQVCVAAGEPGFARTLLLLLGLVSIGVACAFMIAQRDYKRLFAYSSIENMGVIAAGVGLGGGAAYGALLHAVNHSLCKAGLFLLAGNVLREFGTTAAAEVRGVLKRLPLTGTLLAALFLAIGGTPPFAPFVSEFLIFREAIGGPEPWVGVVFLALLAVAFLGMAGVLMPMLQGGAEARAAGPQAGGGRPEHTLAVLAPILMALATLALGVHVPAWLDALLRHAAARVGG